MDAERSAAAGNRWLELKVAAHRSEQLARDVQPEATALIRASVRAAATVDASEWSGLLVTRNVLGTGADDDHAWAVPAGILAFLVDT